MTDNTACRPCNGQGIDESWGKASRCCFCDGTGLKRVPKFRAVCECGVKQPRHTTAWTSQQWMYKHLAEAHRHNGGHA